MKPGKPSADAGSGVGTAVRDDPGVVLSVSDLSVTFAGKGRLSRPVRGVSFDLRRGETLAVVGESGCGKTLSALSLIGLAPRAAQIGGQALMGGRDLLRLTDRQWRGVRGKDISIVFQDPATSFDPVRTVGSQVMESLRTHQPNLSKAAQRARAAELLGAVGIPNPEQRLRAYPHQFSGGMLQRAMIAIAIANEPDVLIADEPTTALDVTVQRQIMQVLESARQRAGASVILITHDFGLVAETADRVVVIYAGRVVESGTVREVFAHPRHPYTVGLLRSVPRLDMDDFELRPIRGGIPDPTSPPPGCAFHPRCWLSGGRQRCAAEVPELQEVASAAEPLAVHAAACHYTSEVTDDAAR